MVKYEGSRSIHKQRYQGEPDKNKSSKSPVYLRFIITYLIIAGIVIYILMPIYHKALSVSKSVYLNETRNNLLRAIDSFENKIDRAADIPDVMNLYQYFTNIKLFRENKLTAEQYVYLYLSRILFGEQCMNAGLEDSSFIILQTA